MAKEVADLLHGQDPRPPLGEVPAYTAIPRLAGLTPLDNAVLIEVTRQALDSDILIALNWNAIQQRLSNLGISPDAALESLVALEQSHLLEGDARGSRVIRLDLTDYGYATAIAALVDDHAGAERAVIASLVNGTHDGDRVGHDLAAACGVQFLVVDRILQGLNDEGYLNYIRTLGNHTRVRNIRPTLKRLLDA